MSFIPGSKYWSMEDMVSTTTSRTDSTSSSPSSKSKEMTVSIGSFAEWSSPFLVSPLVMDRSWEHMDALTVHSESWLRLRARGISSSWILKKNNTFINKWYLRDGKCQTYALWSSLRPSFPTSWQLPKREKVGCPSPALETAMVSTSFPRTSTGSKSMTSKRVSSQAFATTVIRSYKH